MNKAYYNEIDQNACAWLQGLMDQGLIMPGKIDNRSIHDVTPDDLSGYVRVGFFAGIGGWDLALQLAGWPEDRSIWHGSCPCQPFSVAGKGLGTADERHLWPAFFSLIRQCRPDVVFGEQVADAVGKGWLDDISTDLEGEGYACGAVILGAHSVGADHIRKRLYWVADSGRMAHAPGSRRDGPQQNPEGPSRHEARLLLSGAGGADGGVADTVQSGRPERGAGAGSGQAAGGGGAGGLAHGVGEGLEGHAGDGGERCESGWLGADTAGPAAEGGAAGGVDNSGEQRFHGEHPLLRGDKSGRNPCEVSKAAGSGAVGFWDDSVWLLCRDGKHRRISPQPEIFPLSDGLPYKLARRGSVRAPILKGAGNAIIPQVAAAFITSWVDVSEDFAAQWGDHLSNHQIL